ncbi:unnamed protein product [Candidula unifasciata]|uniref:cardiolipin synthase (CMP-forming) n=1 Tax=Candidula unifasciata TaxID=100452 RepID=A0A8S4A363_9EUPU|nr:unnamed protein product [Candidula unifasciata]
MKLGTINRTFIDHLLKNRIGLLVSCKTPWFASHSTNIRHSHWCGTTCQDLSVSTSVGVLTSGALFQSRINTTEFARYSLFALLSRNIHSCRQLSRSNFVPASLDRSFGITNTSFHILDVRKYDAGSYSAKRYVGKSSRNQDDDFSSESINITSTKYRLQDRTRLLIKGRVSRLQSSLLSQKATLREKIRTHRIRGVQAVRHLGKKLQVPREDIRTIPNLLTTLRMASAPVLAYLVVNESFGLACGLFIAASITDMLDGYIARNFKNQTTALGMALDPLADKLLVSFLTISLTSVGLIPVPMTALIMSRDVVLIAGSFYLRYVTLSPPKTLSRYFDVSHVTVKLHPSRISKVNTFLQLTFVASSLVSPVFGFVDHPLLQTLMYLTATTTVLSGADYMLTWRQRVQIIKNK